MPSSEAEAHTNRLLRGYWLGLLFACALIVANCLLNLLIDPVGDIGWVRSHALNRAAPAAVIDHVRATRNTRFYTRRIADTSADVYLIGTSRVARGFDTCAWPRVTRIAGPGWGIREMAAVERAILERRSTPATLLIELGLPSDGGRSSANPSTAFGTALLAPDMTLLSLKTIGVNLGIGTAHAADTACQPHWIPPTSWEAAQTRLEDGVRAFDAGDAALAGGRAMLREMTDFAERTCASRGIRHRILFFSLPATPGHASATRFERLLQSGSARAAALLADPAITRGKCDTRLINFSAGPPSSRGAQAQWRDRANWLDYTHFSPRLGEVALDALLREIRPD